MAESWLFLSRELNWLVTFTLESKLFKKERGKLLWICQVDVPILFVENSRRLKAIALLYASVFVNCALLNITETNLQ